KAEPRLRDVYLASGNLALEKHDFALAAKKFEAGLKELPDDPELHYGLARAYAPSVPALMIGSIEAALERNSNHIGCLLLLADHSIDAEDYAEAGKLLDRILKVNRSEEHTSELQSRFELVCRLLLEKKKTAVTSRTWALRSTLCTANSELSPVWIQCWWGTPPWSRRQASRSRCP